MNIEDWLMEVVGAQNNVHGKQECSGKSFFTLIPDVQ